MLDLGLCLSKIIDKERIVSLIDKLHLYGRDKNVHSINITTTYVYSKEVNHDNKIIVIRDYVFK